MYYPNTKQAQQYKQRDIETATPEEILIMLYDGAIRFLVVAKKGLAEKDLEKFHKNMMNAQQIVMEFMESLDMELGGEVAQNLYSLYEYLHYRLVQGNIKKDEAMVDEVLEHLRNLKKTWEEAIRIARKERQDVLPATAGESSGEESDDESNATLPRRTAVSA